MKLYYVVNARLPNSKAYGIQIAKMCEAFVERGIELELIIPQTRRSHIPLKEFYALRVDVPTRVLAGLDWYDKGSLGFAIGSLVFMASACFYLLQRRRDAVVYTIDMDPYSYAPLALLGIPLAVEMHSPKRQSILNRLFFKRVTRIIATNPLIKERLTDVFGLTPERCIVEPNGVDERVFDILPREEARRELELPPDARIALYVGRFYDWKGIQMLREVSQILEKNATLMYLVGGTQKEFEARTGAPSAPLRFAGSVEHVHISTWCAAADVLLILGTRANEFSYRYTAPMKLYEYLASGRTVVAADTPALRSLVSEQEVVFYLTDDPADLAQKIFHAFSDRHESKQMITNGLQKAREHTWARRAERISASIQL